MLRIPPFVLLMPLACLVFATAMAADESWPLIRGNAEMTGTTPQKLGLPLSLAWSFQAGDKSKKQGVIATPVVQGGKVYIGSQSGKFYCLELATGKEVWKAEKPSFFEGGAAFSGDLVIAGCGDAFVYAWNKNTGAEVWKFETQGEIHAGANIWKGPDGQDRVLIGSYDNKLYCLEAATGKKLWEYETANYVNGAAAIYQNETVFGGCDGTLYVLDLATGKETRKIEVGSYMGNNIAADKGVAYIAHYGNKVAAFAFTDGKKLWEYGERDFPYYAAPAVNATWVIAAGRDKRVHGLDRATGEEKWQFRSRDEIDSSPVICGDSQLIFGSNDGFLYVLDLAKGEELWRSEIGAPVKSAPAIAGENVLIGADDGSVYCFKPEASTKPGATAPAGPPPGVK